MRTLCALVVVLLSSSCNCGGSICSPHVGDAGPQLRSQGEPCTDGVACATGLSCLSSSAGQPFVQEECVASCGDAGACPSGTACLDGEGRATACHATCATDSDCTGRFETVCRPLDAGSVRGVCAPRSCSRSQSTCPGGGTCVIDEYCCPPGAPCAAPRDGFCLR